MAMESDDTGVTLTIAPNASYQSKDLIMERKFRGQHYEGLVKWVRQEPQAKLSPEDEQDLEKTSEEYWIWMRKEEIEACCPHLLSFKTATSSASNTEATAREGSAPQNPTSHPSESSASLENDETFMEMKSDVQLLISRAQKLMERQGSVPGVAGGKVLSTTIGILNAYARIGSLTDAFKEFGALDLLLGLLASKDEDVRKNSSEMLRSLATFDLSIRGYVLLQLTQSDEGSESNLQSRQMLLDLFSETASSGESGLSLKGIAFPQVPGRYIFSILKKYLRVTSFSHNYNASAPSVPDLRSMQGKDTADDEFNIFHLWFQLLNELFNIFCWHEGLMDQATSMGTNRNLKGMSIFTGTAAYETTTMQENMKKRRKGPYSQREEFSSDRDYGIYIKSLLKPGMKVRARCSYETVSKGDYGVYKQTNEGSPPAQFEWEGLGGDTYWVFWHMVEILPPSGEDDDEDEDAAFQTPSVRPYVIRSLALPGLMGKKSEDQTVVQRPFWWEILSLMKSLPVDFTPDVIKLIGNSDVKTFKDLINFSPKFFQVARVLEHLELKYPHITQVPLTIKNISKFHDVYTDHTAEIVAAKDDSEERDINEGKFRREQPFDDPHVIEKPIPSPIDKVAVPDDHNSEPFRVLTELMRKRKEDKLEPTFHMRSLGHLQDGSLQQLKEARDYIEKYNVDFPTKVRVAVSSLQTLTAAYELILDENDQQECCISGHFSLILKLMNVEPKSCNLQVAGLDAFFHLMGGFAMDDSLPVPSTENRGQKFVTDMTKKVVATTLASLFTAPEHGNIKTLFDGMRSIISFYNVSMEASTKRSCSIAIRNGLWIIVFLMKVEEIKEKMCDWKVPELIDLITDDFPRFPTKRDLVDCIASTLPGYIPPASINQEPITPELIRNLNHEVIAVVKALRRLDEIGSKNPLPRLMRLMDRDLTSTSSFYTPRKIFSDIFLLHQGVYYLCCAMEENRTTNFTENALVTLGSIIRMGEEEAAQVVLQGGLRALVQCMNANRGVKKVQELSLEMLTMLAKDPDNLVVMSAENVITSLKSVKDLYLAYPSMVETAQVLTDLCECEETARNYLYQRIISIIFCGALQMMLNSIEDSRREREIINVPKFSAIMKYLSSGTGGTLSMGEKDQWVERVEVSSNHNGRNRVIDGDPTTYWESSGRSGLHWIQMFMKKGVIVRKMYVEVKNSDLTFMPQRISIQAGSSIKSVQDIGTVYIPSTFSGHFEILSNLKKYYSVIILRIVRCHQGGIDTRIHSITCQAAQSSLWPIFGDLFQARSKLFYRIQVQTWLHNPDLGPLELFDMLIAVVLHEQRFADYFLVTAPARRCIGQACRSAIITPLINSLTEESGGPNLGALIHKYINEMQPPSSQWSTFLVSGDSTPGHTPFYEALLLHGKKLTPKYREAQDCLVLMSRIRRMCRLLVDCDENTTSRKSMEEPDNSTKEEDSEKESRPSEDPPGTGTIAVAKFWKEIVRSEVSQVLWQFDSGPPHLLCAKVLGIYDKLKQAMLELFGGHSQFAVALKEGFTKAFQGLDEVQGVRICEKFSLCVHSLMDPFSKDSVQFQALGEHQRESLIMQLAEPLQFIHSLDLAQVLEYYYRRHLSARLLQGRSLSLPLEKRLAISLAHCFPHKYPLQMMEDIEESQKLMDRFCDNELLESLDQVMVHAGAQADLTQEALDLAQKCSFYRQRCCQVIVLNPCFWPLRQHSLPIIALPEPLSTFYQDYTRFFGASCEYGLQQHERPRKLHFTVYGWASLSYGGISLQTSTLQMIVLLQFNSTKTMTLKALHKATNLSYKTLCETLIPMISQGQNILSAVTEQEQPTKKFWSKHGSPPTIGWGQTEDDNFVIIPVRDFKSTTVLTLNESFLSEEGRNNFLFKNVRLVKSKDESLRKDLAHVFDRRRAIMDAAIVRILKSGSESIDTVATMVIKGCTAGKFDNGPSFGRFECDYRDVCSRIDRLILDEYISYDESNKHMLVYNPEQPATAASTTPVQESSKNSKPSSSNKLSFRKRLSSKGKHKKITRYSADIAEKDDAPLLGMLPSSQTLNEEKVISFVKSEINSLSQALNLDDDITEHLLRHCSWEKDVFLNRFLNSCSGLLYESGLAPKGAIKPAPPPKVSNSKGKSSCPVCLMAKGNSEFASLWCGHSCCIQCWRSHVQSRINADQAMLLSCTVQNCRAAPMRSFLVKLFGVDSLAMKKFDKALLRDYLGDSTWMTWCTNPQGCGEILLKGDGMNISSCQRCQWSACFFCTYLESHEPVSCKHMQRWADSGGFCVEMDDDAKSRQLAKIIAKNCPSCSAPIEKDEGCLHMKCKCGHDFCWRCMQPWRPTHTDFFNCTAKVTQTAKDHKKFADYNHRCAVHQKAKSFAEKLCLLVKGINEGVPIKKLSFFSDACHLLALCHKMLGYTCIAEFFTSKKSRALGYLSFLSESFEGDTNALQAFLENALLSQSDLARAIKTFSERQIMDGYRLVSKIENTMEKLLIGYHHRFKLDQVPSFKQIEYSNASSDFDSEEEEEEEEEQRKKRKKEKVSAKKGNKEEDGESCDPKDPVKNEGMKPALNAIWSWAPSLRK